MDFEIVHTCNGVRLPGREQLIQVPAGLTVSYLGDSNDGMVRVQLGIISLELTREVWEYVAIPLQDMADSRDLSR